MACLSLEVRPCFRPSLRLSLRPCLKPSLPAKFEILSSFSGGHPILVKEIEEKNQMTTGSIVWGEYFEFPFLPDKQIKDIRLLIYRDTDRKKSRKDKDFIGLVNIPILSLSSGQFTEKWFPLATPKRSEGKFFVLYDVIYNQ